MKEDPVKIVEEDENFATVSSTDKQSFFEGASGDLADATRIKNKDDIVPNGPTPINIIVCAESFRSISYLCFWGVCLSAYAMSKYVKVQEGFDSEKENLSIQAFFGYSNILTYWDYYPSRDVAAVLFPAFEYVVIIYITSNFFTMYVSYNRGYISKGFWKLVKILFPFKLVLCTLFRMIFVDRAYDDIAKHTTGLLGIQIVLILVALQNAAYIIDAGFSYSSLGGRKGTITFVYLYYITNTIISSLEIICNAYVVVYGAAMPFALRASVVPGWVNGKLIDSMWLLFNAVLPFFISYFRSQYEKPLIIKIGMATPTFVGYDTAFDDEGTNDENKPLLPPNDEEIVQQNTTGPGKDNPDLDALANDGPKNEDDNNGLFEMIDSEMKMLMVAVSLDGNHTWGISTDNEVFYRQGSSGDWQAVEGGLLMKWISVSGDGNHVYGITANDKGRCFYREGGISGQWSQLAGYMQQICISGDGHHCWAVHGGGGVFYRKGGAFTGKSSWSSVNGMSGCTHVTVSASGQHVWALKADRTVWYRAGFEGKGWVAIEGSGSNIFTSDENSVWMVNAAERLFERLSSAAPEGQWKRRKARLSQVSASAGGKELWGVDADGVVWYVAQ